MAGGPHDSETVLFPAIIEADGEGFEAVSPTAWAADRLRQPPIAGEAKSEAVCPDSDLRTVIEAWPTLPRPIKAGILAMIRVAYRAS
jgi:hypothetical protein